MEFTCGEAAKSFMYAQVARMLAARGGELNAHPRIQWGYRDVPVTQTEVWQLEWKIYRSSERSTDPLTYWSLSITSDYRWFIITHDNSDAGPGHPGMMLIHADLLPVRDVTEEGQYSLAALLEISVLNSKPNRYGLS